MTRTIIQLYRGTTAQNDAFTGSAGELSFDTTTNQVRVHDGTTVGGHIIGSGSGYHPDLFSWQWADHELNDVQWLRADTFSWQSGAVYQAAYQHLVDDIDGKTLQSETVGSTTIQFYLADDGHKICPASEETNVNTIYTATGVSWYYIIDTTNQRFKLPRTKHNKYKALLPVSTASSDTITTSNYPGMLIGGASGASGFQTNPHMLVMAGSARDVAQDYATTNVISNSAWLPSNLKADTEQDTDQYKYLYFYVGNFTQTALENTAGLNASLFNGKADTDFGNTSMIDYVIEKQDPTAANNYTWYRKYRSGWVEQGGKVPGATSASAINFPIAMADSNYYINGHVYGNTDQNANWIKFGTRTTTGTTYVTGYGANNMWALNSTWEVKGMAA